MIRVSLLVTLALLAFASNSLLCRLALGFGALDFASFTTLRVLGGALALLLLSWRFHGGMMQGSGSWTGAIALFTYAIAFSWAYLGLSAGTGALLLFGAVQVTMLIAAARQGERLRPLQLGGLLAAAGGLVALVAPGLSAPPPLAAASMAAAGAAWGVYSLLGRRSTRPPLAVTADNFGRAVPLAMVTSVAAMADLHLTPLGVGAALLSGAVSSGIGYSIWYAALRQISATHASIVQLAVPVLAALGGVAFLGEQLTWRLALSGLVVLGGIALSTISPSGSRR